MHMTKASPFWSPAQSHTSPYVSTWNGLVKMAFFPSNCANVPHSSWPMSPTAVDVGAGRLTSWTKNNADGNKTLAAMYSPSDPSSLWLWFSWDWLTITTWSRDSAESLHTTLIITNWTRLQAVLFHSSLQGIHDLPAYEDAQINQQHPTHDDKELLVLDNLEEKKKKKSNGWGD